MLHALSARDEVGQLSTHAIKSVNIQLGKILNIISIMQIQEFIVSRLEGGIMSKRRTQQTHTTIGRIPIAIQ